MGQTIKVGLAKWQREINDRYRSVTTTFAGLARFSACAIKLADAGREVG